MWDDTIRHIRFHRPAFFLGLVFLLLFQSCSPTKYLKENQYILKENQIVLAEKTIDKAEVKNFAVQKPNRTILGWPFYVSLYNMVDPIKEAKRDQKRAIQAKEKNEKRLENGKKLKQDPFYLSRWWRNSVGEAPVIYDRLTLKESKEGMSAYMRNLGYYYSVHSDSARFDKKKQRALVEYHIIPNAPYKISQLNLKTTDKRIESLISSNTKLKIPKAGELFNAYELDNLRYDISSLLQNHGYYGFGPDQIVYFADTLQKTMEAKVGIEIYQTSANGDTLKSKSNFPVYYFKSLTVHNYPYRFDILHEDDMKIHLFGKDSIPFKYYDELTFKPNLLQRRIDIRKDSIYRQEDIARSIRSVGGLGVFKSVHFKVTPSLEKPKSDSVVLLDVEIQLSPRTKQSYSIDLEGYTSSGTIGTGLKFTYNHRNLFKRAIFFDISVNGKVERSTSNLTEGESILAYEYGVNSTLRFPNFFSPFRLYKFNNRYFPSTLVNFGFTLKDRSEYVRQTTSASFGYSWSTPKKLKHNLNPIDFYLTRFRDIQYDYLQYLIDKNLYDQYFDHVIPAGNYSVFYTNQKLNTPKDFFFINLKVEVAGNILTLANDALGTKKTGAGDIYLQVIEAYAHEFLPDSLQEEYINDTRDSLNMNGPGYYTFAGLLYNQYYKTDIDLRYTWYLNDKISLTTRAFGGLIIPYGNTDFSPIEKQYFMGGSNDLRAWWARSVGPGAYVLDEQTLQLKNYYQHGDIKLLANVEFRHNILWRINGALFADIGNVWNIYNNESFPDGLFKFDTFYKQMALGVGYGLRFDFSFFILRFDLAFKLYDPSLGSVNKWVYSQGDSYYKQPILNFGIGYPF
ncbi:BamA/TamA family outer membrane protein [Lentimicrobium sp. L6]|uniref:BamA/TamA family outer membrane protein n=1 Tax=Lentimicrobium sp. L6 TaxID=2735916 RepID=UPI0015529944|nr:BamA/TamA family outer membrane protein [Lentimicrobium sp. L6]NPD86336.1 BamA/TamA family outer membrane protein [Lentimicrobium sp. L6]